MCSISLKVGRVTLVGDLKVQCRRGVVRVNDDRAGDNGIALPVVVFDVDLVCLEDLPGCGEVEINPILPLNGTGPKPARAQKQASLGVQDTIAVMWLASLLVCERIPRLQACPSAGLRCAAQESAES